jgi:hypothetical protein
MQLVKKLGLTGAGTALVVTGALLAGGAATASNPAAPGSKALPRSPVTGAFVSVPPGGNGIASVACPAGKILTGGGGQTSGFRIFFTDSFQSGATWVIRGTNTSTAAESIRAVAICVG